jgi:hypothetical protein
MLRSRIAVVLVLFLSGVFATAQTRNQRLILKDGSYQVVTKYQRAGDRVRYYSAERGQWEEVPAELVDFAATEQWAKDHAPGAHPVPAEQAPAEPGASQGKAPANPEAAAIDKEEQQERARTPEVLPGLRLPDQDGVWALDTFRDVPELVVLTQNTANVDRRTGHNVLRSTLNPLGGTQQNVQIPGFESKVRLHINDPALYVSLTLPAEPTAVASAMTVDTRGLGSAKGMDAVSSATSQYAIIRLHGNFKRDNRVVTGVKIGVGGKVTQSEDVIPTMAQILPGDRWLKLTPKQPLDIGDYALMEVLGPGEVNLSVWDFRIDPQSPDNKNAIMPLQR